MLDEIAALLHRPLLGAFIANAHLPISWQVSPLRSFEESIAVFITADEKIFIAQVNTLDIVPIDLEFEAVERDCFHREFSLLKDKRVFSIRRGKNRRDYSFSPEFLQGKRFSSTADYWDYLVDKIN